jgi:hypothetical protein
MKSKDDGTKTTRITITTQQMTRAQETSSSLGPLVCFFSQSLFFVTYIFLGIRRYTLPLIRYDDIHHHHHHYPTGNKGPRDDRYVFFSQSLFFVTNIFLGIHYHWLAATTTTITTTTTVALPNGWKWRKRHCRLRCVFFRSIIFFLLLICFITIY